MAITLSFAQQPAFVNSADLKFFLGKWSGSLTYLDYSSGKPYTMPADVNIRRIPKTENFTFEHIYPNEPKANSVDTIIVSKNGTMIDSEQVTSKTYKSKDTLEVVTEKPGIDGNDNKPAVIRHTYIVSKSFFSIRKDVKFDGTNEWLKRHEYTYKKK